MANSAVREHAAISGPYWEAFDVVSLGGSEHLSWPDAEAGIHWMQGGSFFGFTGGPLNKKVAPRDHPVGLPKLLDCVEQTGGTDTHVEFTKYRYRRREDGEIAGGVLWMYEYVDGERPQR
jgi:hypothetical protein